MISYLHLTFLIFYFFSETAVDSIIAPDSVLAQGNICISSVAKGFGKICSVIPVLDTQASRQCKLVVSPTSVKI